MATKKKIKQSITVEQHASSDRPPAYSYYVVSAKNTIFPKVGVWLTDLTVQELIDGGCSVNIKIMKS